MKKFIGAAAITMGMLGMGATGANALTQSRSCIAGGSYSANNNITYTANNGAWVITKTEYRYGPADANSTHNNMNEYIYNSAGTLLWSYFSPDSLVRDNVLHTSHTISGGVTVSVSLGSTFRVTNIIDVPGASDPSCGVVFN